jgi:hypothetical protein
VKLWAPERVLNKVENSGRITTDYPKLTCDSDWFHVKTNVSATQEVGIATTSQTEFSGEVSVTLGVSVGPFHGIGVKADTGFTLGKKWTRAVTGTAGLSWGPNQTLETWVRFRVTRTHTDMDRLLAKYGSGGYESDFSSTVIDSKKPLSVGEWEFRYTAPGV